MHIYTYVCVCVCMYVCVFVCVCVCVYYILYAHTHTHTHTIVVAIIRRATALVLLFIRNLAQYHPPHRPPHRPPLHQGPFDTRGQQRMRFLCMQPLQPTLLKPSKQGGLLTLWRSLCGMLGLCPGVLCSCSAGGLLCPCGRVELQRNLRGVGSMGAQALLLI
jgi:hypothetical protein